MKYQTILFDFDSTLVTIEGIDELARMRGVYPEVSHLTYQSMNGELTFEEVFHQRLELIQPQQEDLDQLGKLYLQSLVPGAVELIQQLTQSGVAIYVISGGYLQSILPTTQLLGIPDQHVFAIKLQQNHIAMTQVAKNHILTLTNGKQTLVQSLALAKPIIYVGDGATDLMVKPFVDTFVGFGGVCYRPTIEKASDIYIKSPNLYSVYNYLKE